MTTYKIYTDGACSGNPGPGGYAGIILKNDQEIAVVSGNEKNTTNNRMEMLAIIEVLKYLNRHFNQIEQVDLYSDSKLIIDTLNLGWKKKKNLDLWTQIDQLNRELSVNWIKVKGHSTNKYNNRVDKLAVQESQKIQSPLPISPISSLYCPKCQKPVPTKLGWKSQAKLIKASCSVCGAFIKFIEKNTKNLKIAKQRTLLTKAQIEKYKNIVKIPTKKLADMTEQEVLANLPKKQASLF